MQLYTQQEIVPNQSLNYYHTVETVTREKQTIEVQKEDLAKSKQTEQHEKKIKAAEQIISHDAMGTLYKDTSDFEGNIRHQAHKNGQGNVRQKRQAGSCLVRSCDQANDVLSDVLLGL